MLQSIDAAPLDDVLFEQLEYLVAHAQGACHPECRECLRLRIVTAALTEPFAQPERAAGRAV